MSKIICMLEGNGPLCEGGGAQRVKKISLKIIRKKNRTLKPSRLEPFRSLKDSNLEGFSTLKASNLVVGF